MVHKKARQKTDGAIQASIRKEMAKPRMSRSARIAEANLDRTRIPQQPSATMPGIVDKIIPPRKPRRAEKAQIAVDGADQRHRDIRIENSLTDENGDDVKLTKGAHVDVTIATEAKRNGHD